MIKTKPSKHQPTDDLREEVLQSDAEEFANPELEACQTLLQQAEEKYKRVLADFNNREYQIQTERQQYVKLANRSLIESLLEPIGFMETATKHINDKGLQMVIDRFYQVLQNEGLEEIVVKVGDKFDEKIMEAIDTAEGETGKVIEVRQKGFRLNGVVIKHVRVVVGK